MSINITWDIETNNLLNNESIDYTCSPYKLKPSYKTHCIVVERHDTKEIIAFYNGAKYELDGREFVEEVGNRTYELKDYEPIEYTHYQLNEFPKYIASLNLGKIVSHNGIDFDHLSCKLYFKMDYTIGHTIEDTDTWGDQDVDIVDTLVLSKVLNPDRFGGHALDNLAKMAGKEQKIEFRYHMHQSVRFEDFAADLLYYNIKDVQSNTDVYNYLEWEKAKDDWGSKWDKAIRLEKKVKEIVTRSGHRGFKFDIELAEKCIEELDELMEERRSKVEPLLPPRKATKKFINDHTPPASQILEKDISFPKSFFNKKREVSKTGQNWLDKYEATLNEEEDEICIPNKGIRIKSNYEGNCSFPPIAFTEKSLSANIKRFVDKHDGSYDEDNLTITVFGETMKLPIEVKALKTTMVAKIKDTTHIKQWLVSLGWQPSEYKMKDITLKSGTKIKRDKEDLEKAVDRYIEETLKSEFCRDRCKHLKARPTYLSLKSKIMDKAGKYGCKILTNASFTIGQEKELCKDLERIAKRFPYVMDIVEYLTFSHRRNSILGGGAEWNDEEEADKGYMSHIREDGRIPTEADTCGCSSSRFKHKKVTNIPRTTSLYGKEMRALFGVDKDYLQVGYDFDSLENVIQAHYTWRYEEGDKPYCSSLVRAKPNDSHQRMAEELSKLLSMDFKRGAAKSVGYCIAYGGQKAKVAQTIGCDLTTGEKVFNSYWEVAEPLKILKDKLTKWWEVKAGKKYIIALDGRKVPTRAKHALLNSLFQSGGVICAKVAAVYHDKLLNEAGLSCDFFKEDWKNKKFAQPLIFMHDEAQIEESKTNFIFKSFNSEEEALAFSKEDDKIWSEPIYKGDKVFLGWSLSSELITKAVDMTTTHFKLNAPLSAGYALGRNWSHTH